MGNNKEKAITKMSMKLREENAPAIVEIKVVDDEFSSYMERKIQDDFLPIPGIGKPSG